MEIEEYADVDNFTSWNYTGYIPPERHDAITFQYYVQSVIGIPVAILGLLGNIFSIVILSQPRMKSATSCYLIALAIYDCAVLLSLMLCFSIPIVYKKTGTLFKWYALMYPHFHLFFYPLALTAQTCSIYTTVGFTVERFIAVCYPLKAARWCTMKRAIKGIIIIFFASVVYNIPRWFEYKVKYDTDAFNRTTPYQAMTSFGSDKIFRHIYLIWLQMFIMLLLPFGMLLVLNIGLIIAVHKSQRTQGQLTNSRQQRENSLTIMLIAVIVVFLICQVPSIADNILAVVMEDKVNTPEMVRLTSISSICVIMNSATNFYLYCLFGRKFRKILCQLTSNLWSICCNRCGCKYQPNRTATRRQTQRDSVLLRGSVRNSSLTNRQNGNNHHFERLHNQHLDDNNCCVPYRNSHLSISSSPEHSHLQDNHQHANSNHYVPLTTLNGIKEHHIPTTSDSDMSNDKVNIVQIFDGNITYTSVAKQDDSFT